MTLLSSILSLSLCVIFPIIVGVEGQNEQQPLQDGSKKPNILFILTDDQDLHMDSLSYMPYLKEHLIDRGLSFHRHYCTVALCCPSRVSMWTGLAAHNTNVTDINPPYGGYPKFVSQGFNDNYLPVWLQGAGYGTYYVGKLFNAQSVSNYDSPHAAGWTGSDFLLDPYTYRYLNATSQRNSDKPVSYEGQYVTDVVSDKAHGFLDDALRARDESGQPFFLTVAPTAPHSDVNIKRNNIDGDFDENTNVQSPPVPAERHKHLFEDVVVPRTPNFNPDSPGGASWISRLPKQNQTNVDFNDHFYRNRLRALQAVDEMVDSLMKRLSEAGVLNNTYIVYSTDNGYTIGQHRRQPGKQCAFEQDINVPFIVRGPGVPEGASTDLVTSHTDVTPTFLALTGAQSPSAFELDGQAMPLDDIDAASSRQEHVNIEMWGIIMSEGKYGSVLYPNHTYKAVRVVHEAYSYLYVVWCSGEHELYDMKSDPYQIRNRYDDDLTFPVSLFSTSEGVAPAYSVPMSEAMLASHSDVAGVGNSVAASFAVADVIPRLDALLMVLKTCSGRQCTHPWESLFPDGDIASLADAMDQKYNDFFETKVERVKFDQCEKGYITESEGPMWTGGQVFGMNHEMAFE